jgi:DNA-binding transcriptional ArsR family regulator
MILRARDLIAAPPDDRASSARFFLRGAFTGAEGEGLNRNGEKRWNLWSKQGSVLLYIAVNPDSTVQDIAASMDLTQRAVWDHVGDLRRAGMIEIRKDGRRNRYRINLDGPFLHPTIRGVTLRTLLANLPQAVSREGAAAAAR